MKSKLKTSAILVLFLATSVSLALAQLGGGGGQTQFIPSTGQPQFNPSTGLPISAPQPQAFDPATGQPIAQAVPDWKDPNWTDPKIVLTNVNFEGLPWEEIANFLRDQFKGEFDIILPQAPIGGAGNINRRTGLPMEGPPEDWNSGYSIRLRLKNVTASELFNAMNLVFENDKVPLQWDLKVLGHRQVALLHVLTDVVPNSVPVSAPTQRRVYFVGNLIGDGMSMEQIIKTVTDVWQMANASGGNIQFHKDAQLLVVTGTQNQIDFMEQTLQALSEKMNLQKTQPRPPVRFGVAPGAGFGPFGGRPTNE